MDLLKTTLEVIHPRSLKYLSDHLNDLLRRHLWAKVLFGFALGIALGVLLSEELGYVSPALSTVIGEWLAFPGQLFLRMVQMIVIPLIFASVIRGVASSESVEQLKKLGLRIGIYFVMTTAVSLVIGLAVVQLIEPGRYIDVGSIEVETTSSALNAKQMDTATESFNITSIPDAVLGLLPQNPLTAMNDSNMLQVVLFSLIVGFALIAMKAEQAQPLLGLLGSIQQVCMTVVKWAMRLAPIAVFGLTTKTVSTLGFEALVGLGVYVGTVLLGLVLIVVFYLGLVVFIGKRNPIKFLRSIVNVQLLAFSTSSSAAVMPLSIKTAEESLDVHPSISQFVVPLGSTVNMDGTALYQMIATVFLAQVFHVDLSSGEIVLIGLTAIGASIGSPGTPGVGIVILASILQSVGIPLSGIALILAVDRILDMCRTAVNVTGDLAACVVMDRLIGRGPNTNEVRMREVRLELERSRSGEDVIIST